MNLVTDADLISQFSRMAGEIDHHRSEMSRLGQQRREIVWELMDRGMGYGSIAEACGVSKGLIQNIANLRPLREES